VGKSPLLFLGVSSMKIQKFEAMLNQIQEERGIKKEDVVAALEEALLLAAKKRFPDNENLEVKITDKGETKVFDNGAEITPADFGRLAAQTAKQVIIQRIREAEKDVLYNEFRDKIGQIINAIVQRKEQHGYLVNIGRAETYLSDSECIPGENLRPKERVRLVIIDVKKVSKGPVVVVSRAHPDFIKKLFEMEVPEIQDGILEIKAIAREPGRRTKIAIKSNDSNVGVIGTCVGQMGSRIQNVTRELGGERIDIIEWSENLNKYLASSLSPAKPSKIEINEEAKSTRVIFPNKELSLAIGKEGQNVRLAARLTGYRIDIVSEEEAAEALKNKKGETNASEKDEKEDNQETGKEQKDD